MNKDIRGEIYNYLTLKEKMRIKGNMAKNWFLIFKPKSGVLNGFTCNKCTEPHK